MAGALIPTLLVLVLSSAVQIWFVRRFLRKGEISKRLQWFALLWGGVVSIIASAILQTAVGGAAQNAYTDKQARLVFESSVAGPFIEEAAKGFAPLMALVFFGACGKRALLVLGCLAGTGFFFTESIFFLLGAARDGSEAWGREASLRGIIYSLGHAGYAGFTGLGLGFASKSNSKILALTFSVLGFTAAWFAHGYSNIIGVGINAGFAREGWELKNTLTTSLVIIYLVLLFVARRRIKKNPAPRAEGPS